MDRYWSTIGNILVVHNSIGNIVGYSSPDEKSIDNNRSNKISR